MTDIPDDDGAGNEQPDINAMQYMLTIAEQLLRRVEVSEAGGVRLLDDDLRLEPYGPRKFRRAVADWRSDRDAWLKERGHD